MPSWVPASTLALLLAMPLGASASEPDSFERPIGALAWSVATFEVATTAALMLRGSVWRGPMDETSEGLLLSAPMILAGGGGVAGWLWCLPPRVAFALHAGVYTGLAVGLATALVRGALGAGGRLRFVAPEGIGALVGTVPGLFVGALEVDPNDPLAVFLGAPPAGMLAGALGAGVLLVVLFLSGNDPGAGGGDQAAGWPIFAGLATGLVVATGSVVGSDP